MNHNTVKPKTVSRSTNLCSAVHFPQTGPLNTGPTWSDFSLKF